MSKYKYTGLLSSQYRQIFKYYHSLDRHEVQLKKSNLHNIQTKQILSCFHSSQKPLISSQNKSHQIFSNISQPHLQYQLRQTSHQSQKQGRTRLKTTSSFTNNINAKIQNRYCTKIPNIQKQVNQIRNKYETIKQFSSIENNLLQTKFRQSLNQIDYNSTFQKHSAFNIKEILLFKVSSIALNSISHSKNELKMKVSEINKKRNDLKLKVRVNDIDKINKRYDYLHQQPQRQGIKINENTIVTNNNFNWTNDAPRQPMKQINLNKNIQKSAKDNFEPQKALLKYREEQNIQTPHFYQAETKKNQIDVSLIQRKLQKLVKNTFTDRY